ncbi:hypothetical protein ACFO0A_11635 [Novosphingobium tardum]|uniref:Uncharacterized protein n=1 Tax=Novosphingobium tardum TaxID=1538021 RepID=A0ABV8RSR4_9SPHN
MRRGALLLAALLGAAALPAGIAAARDSLGIYGRWGAFRDPQVPRCYAIAMAEVPPGRRIDYRPFATVGHWPRRGIRNQVHFRLSRQLVAGSPIRLAIGSQRFDLAGGGGDAWALDARMDAAIVAALRSAETMSIAARSVRGGSFRDNYTLAGAATAIDAAAVGCARTR